MKLAGIALKRTLVVAMLSAAVTGLGIAVPPAFAGPSGSLQDIIDKAKAYIDSIEVYGLTFDVPSGWDYEINTEMEETESTIFYEFSDEEHSFLGIFYDLTDIFEIDEIDEFNQLDPDLYGEEIASEFGTTYIDSLSYQNESTSFTLLFLTAPQGAPGNMFAFAMINGTRPVQVSVYFDGRDLEEILAAIDEFYGSIEPAGVTYGLLRTLAEEE